MFYRNLRNNKININGHKKNQTSYLSPHTDISSKYNPCSPNKTCKTNNKQKKYYNINKTDNLSSKIKSKIAKGRINNLNINFNNVIFNAPLSNISQNLNFNSNIINNSKSFNIVSNSNNNIMSNNTFLNNNNSLNNSNNTNINLSEGSHKKDKTAYILNLKNVYNNISRNRLSIYGNCFNQTENFSLTNNLTKTTDKSRVINHTYSNLYSNDKGKIFITKKNRILIKKQNNKSGNQKHTKKIIKNSKKNIKTLNKKIENLTHTNRIKKNIKILKNKKIEIREKNIASFHSKEKEKENSKILYISPNTTGRNVFIAHRINVNRNSNLLAKKFNKSRIKKK